MRRFTSTSLAVASAILCCALADAARPRYGGTLRVETSALMRSLNPGAPPLDAPDAAARGWLQPLIFETLTMADGPGGPAPGLATGWQRVAGTAQWQFDIRSGVTLHDGSPLDGPRVAAALRLLEPSWQISADGQRVLIDAGSSAIDVPWLVAGRRYAVAFGRPGGGEPIGTGPFAIERSDPRRLSLRAHDRHWAGRPFVDAVQIQMGRALPEQLASLEAGRADFVQLLPQDVRRASSRGRRVLHSDLVQLVTLVPARRARKPGLPLRRAIDQLVDRAALQNAVLQRQGVSAATLLPQWLTGYPVSVASDRDSARARAAVADLPAADRSITLTVDGADTVLRAIADRIVVDAREAGLTVTLGPATPQTSGFDLLRGRLVPSSPERALRVLLDALGVPYPSPAAVAPSAEVESAAARRWEQSLLEERAVIPLVHLPDLYVVGQTVEAWNRPMILPAGAWNLADVWLKPGVAP